MVFDHNDSKQKVMPDQFQLDIELYIDIDENMHNVKVYFHECLLYLFVLYF